MTSRAAASAERGAKRRAATETALREAWERLRAGAPTNPDLVSGTWRLSIQAVALEAGCSRDAIYDGHPELLAWIKSDIAKQQRVGPQTQQNARRSRVEELLAACQDDRQRLISENAALLLRALTAEEALAHMKRREPLALKDDR
jgi:hypothetical protein